MCSLRVVDANEGGHNGRRLEKQNKPMRQMTETLEMAKSTVWFILKKEEMNW